MRIRTQNDIKQLGTILGVWAHPDDETWTSALLMAMAAENGQNVTCVSATNGEDGVQDEQRWPRQQLGTIRQAEVAAATKVLGIPPPIGLGCHDGQCRAQSQKGIAQLTSIITQQQPDTILTFGPTGTTGHPDHIAVSLWVSQIVNALPNNKQPQVYHSVHSQQWYEKSGKLLDEKFNVFFNIDSPPLIDEEAADIVLRDSKKFCKKKLAALQAHTSQTARMFEQCAPQLLTDFACCELFVRAPDSRDAR